MEISLFRICYLWIICLISLRVKRFSQIEQAYLLGDVTEYPALRQALSGGLY
ncbi:MAG: hypothetical protein HGA71_05880 [Azonexaceae bacterium]|nr:hypothetical protein [Azonexaceae bacterium]